METEKPLIKPIAYTYGLYLGLLTIVVLVFQYITGLEKNWTVSITSLVITIVIFYYGIKKFKEQNHNYLSLTDALKVGLAIAVIGALIGAIYAFIHYSYIQPEFVDTIRENSYKEMTSASPNMSEEQLATATKMTNIFTSPFFLATMSLLMQLFFGFIISLILGAIMKKEDPSLA